MLTKEDGGPIFHNKNKFLLIITDMVVCNKITNMELHLSEYLQRFQAYYTADLTDSLRRANHK
ncbi:MAG: hypothetical protein AMS27_01555 [Bacteroides sp. SM23_62_1]|nr:MAG: hypothetical protein AMS27_01555 [Bacteroides sp. SM23_62_1]